MITAHRGTEASRSSMTFRFALATASCSPPPGRRHRIASHRSARGANRQRTARQDAVRDHAALLRVSRIRWPDWIAAARADGSRRRRFPRLRAQAGDAGDAVIRGDARSGAEGRLRLHPIDPAGRASSGKRSVAQRHTGSTGRRPTSSGGLQIRPRLRKASATNATPPAIDDTIGTIRPTNDPTARAVSPCAFLSNRQCFMDRSIVKLSDQRHEASAHQQDSKNEYYDVHCPSTVCWTVGPAQWFMTPR